MYEMASTHYSLPNSVSPNYKTPSNSFQFLDFPASHSNDTSEVLYLDSNQKPCYHSPCLSAKTRSHSLTPLFFAPSLRPALVRAFVPAGLQPATFALVEAELQPGAPFLVPAMPHLQNHPSPLFLSCLLALFLRSLEYALPQNAPVTSLEYALPKHDT